MVRIIFRPHDLIALPYVVFMATIGLLMFIDSAAGRILWGSIGLFVGLISLIGVNNAMVRNHPKDEFDERI